MKKILQQILCKPIIDETLTVGIVVGDDMIPDLVEGRELCDAVRAQPASPVPRH